ncbi:MAG: Gfo/Idh/MocA family protein, partial [Mycobacteriales bacterium]
MSPTRRIGLVGTGLMGGHHAWALQALHAARLTDARLAVVYDANAERLAAAAGRLGVAAAPHLASLVEDADIVWICTWTAAHLQTARVAAAAGRAVFVEKPLAPTLADCEALAALLRGTPHQVGLILRHAPAYALVVSEAGSGRYGRPMGAFFRDDQRFPIDATYGSTWRADVAAAGGGTLIEH